MLYRHREREREKMWQGQALKNDTLINTEEAVDQSKMKETNMPAMVERNITRMGLEWVSCMCVCLCAQNFAGRYGIRGSNEDISPLRIGGWEFAALCPREEQQFR